MEKKYVDADLLFKAMENAAWYDNADRDDIAEELLLNFPAADAVPVVRCRDCKFAHLTNDGEVKRCDEWSEIEELYLSGDFFCASGQRRA